MDVKEIALKDLRPYDKNPRKNDRTISSLVKSIEQFGFKVPLVVDRDNVIVAGHTRYKAAKKLGLEKVPCIIADDLTPEQIRAFRLADNKTSELASWDSEKLDAELNSLTAELSEIFSFELPKAEEQSFMEPSTVGNLSRPQSGFKRNVYHFTTAQKSLVEVALLKVGSDVKETFGNSDKNGNALYEIARQWLELRGK